MIEVQEKSVGSPLGKSRKAHFAHASNTTKRDHPGARCGVVFLSPARFEARCRAPDGLKRRGSWEE